MNWNNGSYAGTRQTVLVHRINSMPNRSCSMETMITDEAPITITLPEIVFSAWVGFCIFLFAGDF